MPADDLVYVPVRRCDGLRGALQRAAAQRERGDELGALDERAAAAEELLIEGAHRRRERERLEAHDAAELQLRLVCGGLQRCPLIRS